MKSPFLALAVICTAAISFAAVTTAPSSQPSTRPATTRRATRIRPDAPDAVQRVAKYSFQFHQRIIKQKQDVWDAAKIELQQRVNGKIDATKATGASMTFAPNKPMYHTWTFKTGIEREMAIEEQRTIVVDAKTAWETVSADSSIVLPSWDVQSPMLEVGWIGLVKAFYVEEIIDDHSMRARIRGIGPSAQVYGAEGAMFIITSADGSVGKLREGANFVDLPIWVKGTQKDSKSGRTAFKAEVFDLSQYLTE